MGAFNKFTPEEDYLILKDYWNTDRRKDVSEAMADRHTAKSVQFRYFQLLKLLNLGSAAMYRRMMEAHEQQGTELPFDLDGLVRKLHSGELKAEQAKKRKEEPRKEEPSEESRPFFKSLQEPLMEAKAPQPSSKKQHTPLMTTPSADEETFDDPLIPILARMQQEIQNLNRKVEQISVSSSDKALVDLFTFLANAARHKEQIANLEAIIDENRRLKEENQQLKEKYQEKAREFEDIYQRLDEVWGHFMRLTSVKKAMSLEDFIDQLRFVIDRFGTVVDVTTRDAGLRGALKRAKEAVLG